MQFLARKSGLSGRRRFDSKYVNRRARQTRSVERVSQMFWTRTLGTKDVLMRKTARFHQS